MLPLGVNVSVYVYVSPNTVDQRPAQGWIIPFTQCMLGQAPAVLVILNRMETNEKTPLYDPAAL